MSSTPLVVEKNELGRRGAEWISRALLEAVAGGQRASLALSGGSTTGQVYRELAKQDVPWALVDFYFVDERFVPPDNPDSNYLLAEETLLGGRGVPFEIVEVAQRDVLPEPPAPPPVPEHVPGDRENPGSGRALSRIVAARRADQLQERLGGEVLGHVDGRHVEAEVAVHRRAVIAVPLPAALLERVGGVRRRADWNGRRSVAHANALCPVIACPTMSECMSWVPS